MTGFMEDQLSICMVNDLKFANDLNLTEMFWKKVPIFIKMVQNYVHLIGSR